MRTVKEKKYYNLLNIIKYIDIILTENSTTSFILLHIEKIRYFIGLFSKNQYERFFSNFTYADLCTHQLVLSVVSYKTVSSLRCLSVVRYNLAGYLQILKSNSTC